MVWIKTSAMPRQLRIQYEGAIYHLMSRGDRREPIFLDEKDQQQFLLTLGQTCCKTGWQVHAYCLMSNHFHLVVETPRANLCARTGPGYSATITVNGLCWTVAEPTFRYRTWPGDANASRRTGRAQLEKGLFVRDLVVMRIALSALLTFVASIAPVLANDSNLKSEEVYSAWLQMYDLKFEEAHRTLERWQESHPDDPLGPASDAAGYLFSELARLGVLESQLFVDDNRFKNRKTLDPDAQVKASFMERIGQADRLADLALRKSDRDARALFAKTLTHGLRADYIALIDGRGLKALSYTKAGRVFANRLLAVDPEAFDAYLGSGIENYLLSLKPVAVRLFLRLTGSETDREKGLEQLRKTAHQGYYLEPFAKLLLGVAALRDNQKDKAREILTELHNRFPDNQLYAVELDRLVATQQ